MPATTPAAEHAKAETDTGQTELTAAEGALLKVLSDEGGELQVRVALATTRKKAHLGSFLLKAALWSLIGRESIELTPGRTLRILPKP